jgi:SAM-dependent methyltransferase
MSTSFSNPDYSAKSYLDHRPRYPQQLYESILQFHRTPTDDYPTPQTKLALDLGCGPVSSSNRPRTRIPKKKKDKKRSSDIPFTTKCLLFVLTVITVKIQGIATSELVPHFEKVVAIDESEPMIKIASAHLPQVDCRVGSATRIPVESGTVDLITVATAGLLILLLCYNPSH